MMDSGYKEEVKETTKQTGFSLEKIFIFYFLRSEKHTFPADERF